MQRVMKAAGLAVALAACAATPVLAADLKIALIAGKTGALEAYAKQTETGLMMGLEYLTKGTMTWQGRKIQVIVKDDQLKPDLAKSLLEQAYADDNVDIAIGTSSSGAALAMLPVAEEHKKILIVEPAVADAITGEKWNRYIFRTARSSMQDAYAAAAAFPKTGEVHVGTLAQDYAFGRDGIKALKDALAELRPNVKVVFEEYAPTQTTDFTASAQRLFDALKDKPGKKVIAVIWAGPHPLPKIADLKPERYGIEIAPGGNILPVMKLYKPYPGMEGAVYYYYDFPKNPMNDWFVAEHKKRFQTPPDFFTAGGFAAASAILTAVEKAGGTDTEKLIAAMEGMTFDTPKGKMQFRKEDHQALQSMYHFKVKKDGKDENDLLDLVQVISPQDMPLPIRNKR
ncbi:substrate-binding domain-containing protein [uncultured Ferrovibrio sp.]|jgi:branched-chain amino acid transport system substrate-binding protein|uniref:substrate-binding domain-containing protein n=1 Tax=uncultured Ferrovibrio sp. TaxID=1576913 RepID=UPI002635BDA2|nr:substrate-binding domain-containing protein [uncultured Ferrovibrio sp.]